MTEGTAECPTRCGKKETKVHYLLCTDKELQKGRNQLLKILQQKLKNINTYPGITMMIGKILMLENKDEWWTDQTSTNGVEKALYDTIEGQSGLREYALAKGYITKDWREVQKQWENISNSPHST